MRSNQWERQYGSSETLGATWIEEENAWNFALYSKHATQVTLYVYNQNVRIPCYTFAFNSLLNKTGRVWHARIPNADLNGGIYYGYKVDGPTSLPNFGYDWQNFDKYKVLLDPYASSVYFPPDFSRRAASQPGPNDGKAPLGRLCAGNDSFDWENDGPSRHGQTLIIYELHVGHFTKNSNSGLSSPSFRGTYRGVIEKIPYLKELGVTAVELMPVFQFDPQEGSGWGYMTLNFFAPHHAYSVSPDACKQKNEFREMVKALHLADMEVLLDVVYNHTTEGDQFGPTYSLKGIDCSSYYMINKNNFPYPFDNRTGCGNTILASSAPVRRLVLDSMRYWVEEMHVDGFRFDLASVLAYDVESASYKEEIPLFDEIAADPVLNRVRLIAENWDMESGKFPGRVWHQWNGAYRDCLRRFVKGDGSQIGELMTRLYGSPDKFPDDLQHSMQPWQSVNYIASHDGFRMADLVSFMNPLDESGNENSWDCGYPGVSGAPPQVIGLRKRQMKNFCALLMLSNGTPMIAMGDEVMHDQQGRKNPYNIDSPLTWFDWDQRQTNNDVFSFFKKMIDFRKDHPSLARFGYWRNSVTWHGPNGPYDLSDNCRTLAFFLDGSTLRDDDLYVMANAWWQPVDFCIQEGQPTHWERALDTSLPSPTEFVGSAGPQLNGSGCYRLEGRSVAVFVRKKSE